MVSESYPGNLHSISQNKSRRALILSEIDPYLAFFSSCSTALDMCKTALMYSNAMGNDV